MLGVDLGDGFAVLGDVDLARTVHRAVAVDDIDLVFLQQVPDAAGELLGNFAAAGTTFLISKVMSLALSPNSSSRCIR